MNVVRSHNLFIQTQYGSPDDTPYNYSIEIPESTIRLDEPSNQIMRLTLFSFSMPYTYPQINASNNTIIITDIYNVVTKTITLPQGTYPYGKIRDYINNQWGTSIVTWDISQMKFVFTTTSMITLTFINKSYHTFGFNLTDQNITGRTITSTNVLSEKLLQNIYVCIDDMIQSNNSLNFDNIGINNFKPSNILMVIPINVEPWDILYFRDVNYAREFSINLPVTDLTRLQISLRDGQGNYLQGIPNYEATLKIEIVNVIDEDTRAILNNLSLLRNDLKQMKMLKYFNHIKKNIPEIPQIKILRSK